MSDELQVYEPPSDDNKPNWGVIILTGLTALLLVVGIGFLSQQVSQWWDSIGDNPTETPSRQPERASTGSPAVVYAVPHRGEWQITAHVAYAEDTIIHFSSNGTGTRIEPPRYDLPTGGSVVTEELYQIIVEYPLLTSSSDDSENEILFQDTPEAFRTALQQNYYALYDSRNRFIEVINQAAYDETYWALPLEYWGIAPPAPPLTSTPTP